MHSRAEKTDIAIATQLQHYRTAVLQHYMTAFLNVHFTHLPSKSVIKCSSCDSDVALTHIMIDNISMNGSALIVS